MFDSDNDDPPQLIFPRQQNPYFPNPNLNLKNFQRTRYIASGAFGKVQQYFSPQKNEFFAVKMMKFDGKNDLKNIREIKRQLQILYKINSPYLVRLYDHFQEENSAYLIMEYVEGNNLYDCLFKPKIQLQMYPICKMVNQMCQGLEELHRLKIVHRDIKLQNILLTDASIKIIDLGQSNHYGEGVDRITYRGTKPYFCPQILNRQQQDDRIDVWCLGVVLYELVCMNSPFTNQKQDLMIQNIRRLNYQIPEKIKYQKQLLDLFSKIFTYKSQRIRISEVKSHPFLKKYLNEQRSASIRYENYYTQQQILQYRQYLISQISKYKDCYKETVKDNQQIQQMIEKTQKKIYGIKNLNSLN